MDVNERRGNKQGKALRETGWTFLSSSARKIKTEINEERKESKKSLRI